MPVFFPSSLSLLPLYRALPNFSANFDTAGGVVYFKFIANCGDQ